MARCSCTGSQCSCLIVAGEGIIITGSGHPSDPYVITNAWGPPAIVQDAARLAPVAEDA